MDRIMSNLRLAPEMIARVFADALMINISVLAALVLRFLYLVAFEQVRPGLEYHDVFWGYLTAYRNGGWLLTLICLVIFFASGFYTYGRAYRGRYKVLIVVQAVSLSYLLFGFLFYFLGGFLRIPRGAWVLAWVLSMVLLIAARVWALVWAKVVRVERHQFEQVEERELRKVLVIGGAGYIGSVLCRQLLRKDYSVRVLDALLYGRESLVGLLDDPHFELLEGDSRDVGDVFRALLGVDAVVHLGELVGDPACALDEKLTEEVNLAATRMVAEAARGCGVRRFIYASSCSVYGTGKEMLNERSVLSPVSLYARAKVGSEQALLALNGSDFHPVVLRFATVYGLSPRPRFDLVINLLTAKAVCDGEITIFGGGQWRPFVHVADVAEAIIRCLEAPLMNVKGQVFNVGSDKQNYTVAQVGELIQQMVPKARLVNQGEDTDKRDYHVSFAKIRRELGFVPHHTVESGVREIEAALQDGRIEDYRASRYSNYKTLSDPSNHLSVRSGLINELYAATLGREDVEDVADGRRWHGTRAVTG
jgi:nucleoside-diphosphate-sugar epimerase